MSRRSSIILLLIALLPAVLMPAGGMLCICKLMNLGCTMTSNTSGALKSSCCASRVERATTSIRSHSDCRLCVTLHESPRAIAHENHDLDRFLEATLLAVVTIECAPAPISSPRMPIAARVDTPPIAVGHSHTLPLVI